MNKWILLIGSIVMFSLGYVSDNKSDMSVAVGLAWVTWSVFWYKGTT